MVTENSADVRSLLEMKIHAIENLMSKKNGHLCHSDYEIFQRNMSHIKRITEICTVQANSATKMLDTAGNFFKVAKSVEQGKMRRASSRPDDPNSLGALVRSSSMPRSSSRNSSGANDKDLTIRKNTAESAI